ncbi:LptF/LptG family permease [Paracrocinitomix mangrovi]|uniref:LptF/LptG family permease n=1 Tax=Paracrocinitomix mangrovi TaxID=2862509 RepID=UPI001C8D1DD9|nr:LptF/LptG family permease [Paracrocinitomix mangrovi]UKN01388.1 LptF/LptG family permease [Paracrocinitomix mangrovi]
MIITKLDKYIIGKFLGTFIFIMILLMSISMVFDLSEKLNDFIAAGAPWNEIIFTYYSNFFIFYGFQFIYLINFISVIWFTSKMTNNSEIVPILSAGISFNRFLRPYFISSAILVVFTILMTNFVLPGSNEKRLRFETMYYRDFSARLNVRSQVTKDQILYFGLYNATTEEIRNFRLDKFNGDSLEYTMKSPLAFGDSLTNDWHFDKFELRRFSNFHDDISYGFNVDTVLEFSIGDVVFKSNVIESMNYTELEEFIEREQAKGSEKVPYYLIEKYKRWSNPFAIFILTLIGVSVSSRKPRGGLGVNIAIGFAFAVAYIFSMQLTTVAAIKVGFTPFLAVWIPNILFGIAAIIMYRIAPK